MARKRNKVKKPKNTKAQHRVLKAKGRKSWNEFKEKHDTLAAERIAVLNHFKNI